MPSKIGTQNPSQQTNGRDEKRELLDGYWWWAFASSAQLAVAIFSYRRGYNGRDTLMPFKAFSVASLFVGAGASAVAGVIHASGIRAVDDLKEVGASLRGGMGIPPREESK